MDVEKMTQEEIKGLFERTEEELLSMDEVEFRARFRERCHHTMEIQLYECAYRNKAFPAKQLETAKKYLRIWEKRGLSHEFPEYRYVNKLLEFAGILMEGENLDLSEYEPKWLTEEEIPVFERTLYERRSVRHWDISRRVPDEIIDKILKAGLWAAHACNLQSIRYLVVREESEPGLFRGSDIPGGPVHIVLLQDMRNYRGNQAMPEYNQLLDCGAAGQNIVLAAHAYGLGGTWLTFNPKMRRRLTERFQIPEEIRVVTYVDVGYPEQSPFPPLRLEPEDATFARI
ncbi:nitroreductase family protein [Qiania dongpingensis]|uniref:Nitroreductase family protein n=1 Tax=Qiania dongpingensis TaxID=2763669 RepID=A0A7G9G1F2_9FIRM|nr:nitroreductase family protein [Qiania dongpingensis]QNM04634.1 nitroreductase family protein [Qiania dongpingensis]